MKNYSLIALITFFGLSLGVQAQFDDLYYNPEAQDSYEFSDSDYDDVDYDDTSYDDDEYVDYEYWSEYEDNYYTNRINRNRRANVRPVWTNSWAANSYLYNPYDFYNPYNTAFVGGPFVASNICSPYAYNRFYSPAFSYGTFNSPLRIYSNIYSNRNRRIYNGYNRGIGFNRGIGIGGYGNAYCPVGGNTIAQTRAAVVNLPSPAGTYRGSRRTGFTYGSNGTIRNQTVRSDRSSSTLKNNSASPRDFSSTRSSVRSKRSTATRATTRPSTTRTARPSTTRPTTRTTTRPSTRTTTRSSRSTFNNNNRSSSRSNFNTRRSTPSSSRSSGIRSSSRSSSGSGIRSSRGGRR